MLGPDTLPSHPMNVDLHLAHISPAIVVFYISKFKPVEVDFVHRSQDTFGCHSCARRFMVRSELCRKIASKYRYNKSVRWGVKGILTVQPSSKIALIGLGTYERWIGSVLQLTGRLFSHLACGRIFNVLDGIYIIGTHDSSGLLHPGAPLYMCWPRWELRG
jgi:hypothetical protein